MSPVHVYQILVEAKLADLPGLPWEPCRNYNALAYDYVWETSTYGVRMDSTEYTAQLPTYAEQVVLGLHLAREKWKEEKDSIGLVLEWVTSVMNNLMPAGPLNADARTRNARSCDDASYRCVLPSWRHDCPSVSAHHGGAEVGRGYDCKMHIIDYFAKIKCDLMDVGCWGIEDLPVCQMNINIYI